MKTPWKAKMTLQVGWRREPAARKASIRTRIGPSLGRHYRLKSREKANYMASNPNLSMWALQSRKRIRTMISLERPTMEFKTRLQKKSRKWIRKMRSVSTLIWHQTQKLKCLAIMEASQNQTPLTTSRELKMTRTHLKKIRTLTAMMMVSFLRLSTSQKLQNKSMRPSKVLLVVSLESRLPWQTWLRRRMSANLKKRSYFIWPNCSKLVLRWSPKNCKLCTRLSISNKSSSCSINRQLRMALSQRKQRFENLST